MVQKMDWEYEVVREGEETILIISCETIPYIPSLEDTPEVMSHVMDILVKAGTITKIILTQKRDYEYDTKQTELLVELAQTYKKFLKQNLFKYDVKHPQRYTYASKYTELQNLLFKKFKEDPLGTYVELKRILRREKIFQEKTNQKETYQLIQQYIDVLQYLVQELEKTRFLSLTSPYLAGYKIGDRSVYRYLFAPLIKPDFMFTKLMADYPTNGEEVESYTIAEDTEVTLFKFPDKITMLYHLVPPEFKLSEEKYELLDTARKVLSEHKPKHEEFTDPEHIRQVFYNIGKDLLEELAQQRGIVLRDKDLDKLTKILVRYTIGFGLIEVLLEDDDVQDVSINSPLGKIPMFIVHGKYGECTTNIIPTINESESWASKLRLISGRPLDEANPVLDTELELPGANTRVAVITSPLNPTGLAYSFRRHRSKPWTLPLFIKYKMINPLAAGLISFLVDGTRSMIIAGTRSAGKSSFLASVMVEILRKHRILTIEDTLELPVRSLRNLGYNLQSMKVASALAERTAEVSATEGIRTTLRLGDSALIIGEVRSKEAIALFESMRIGAAANVVAGTIHGDSPYGVYDRVVNDIGVPKTSFKATDIIIVANPIKSADGLHSNRRVTQITEVQKFWTEDPLSEGAFVDLMKYDVKKDTLVVTEALKNGESEILKTIAGNVKEFAGDWDAMWDNILLRAKIKEALVDYAEKENLDELLEAPFVIMSNDQFHILSDNARQHGRFKSELIYQEWIHWLEYEINKKKVKQRG